MTRLDLKNMPKIELHCHLDGSIRPETALELGKKLGLLTEATSLDEVIEQLRAPSDCDSLVTYLKRFDLPIALMQTTHVIERIAYELFEDAALENVKYLEVRFAPHLHTRGGLTLEAVIQAAITGMQRATNQYEIKGNYILSHLRHHTPESMLALIDAGKAFLSKGVVAVDLAGAENLGFAGPFVEAIAVAKGCGFHITIHAGETGYEQNVMDAIQSLGASRVGHGVAIAKDPGVLKLVKENSVLVEVCPTSNLQTRIVPSINQHPIDYFKKSGLLVSINTDNRTVSDTNMTKECSRVQEAFEWLVSDFKSIYHQSIGGAFCDESVKSWLEGLWDDNVTD